MFPVFSLVLDQDVKPEMAMLYPELYKDLTKVRPARPREGGSCNALRKTVLVRRGGHLPSPGAARFVPGWAGGLGSSQVPARGRWETWCCSIDRAAPLSLQGRALSFKTFLVWVLVSIYQGKADPSPGLKLPCLLLAVVFCLLVKFPRLHILSAVEDHLLFIFRIDLQQLAQQAPSQRSVGWHFLLVQVT